MNKLLTFISCICFLPCLIISVPPIHTQNSIPQPQHTPRLSREFRSIDMQFTSTNIPVIIYSDYTSRINLITCVDILCTNNTSQVLRVVSGWFEFGFSQIKVQITSDDIPIVLYIDPKDSTINLIYCDNLQCKKPVYKVISKGADYNPSFALTNDNRPVITYRGTRGSLDLIICMDSQCNVITRKQLEPKDTWNSTVAVSSTGIPLISHDANIVCNSYWGCTYSDAILSVCDDQSCTNTSKIVLGNSDWTDPKVQISSTDIPYILFDNKIYACSDLSCNERQYIVDGNGLLLDSNDKLNFITITDQEVYQSIFANSQFSHKKLFDYTDHITLNFSLIARLNSSNLPVFLYNADYYYDPSKPLQSYPDFLQLITCSTPNNPNCNEWISHKLVGKLPDYFTKSMPSDATTLFPESIQLQWSTSSPEATYEYCLKELPQQGCKWEKIGSNSAVTIVDSKLSPLKRGKTYYWQVRARNTEGVVYADNDYHDNFDNTDAFWMFTVADTPQLFSRSLPVQNAVRQLTSLQLSWQPSINASTYEYCISTSATCTNWISTGTNTQVSLNDLQYGTTYFWQVRAINTNGNTMAIGDYWKFTTRANTEQTNTAIAAQIQTFVAGKKQTATANIFHKIQTAAPTLTAKAQTATAKSIATSQKATAKVQTRTAIVAVTQTFVAGKTQTATARTFNNIRTISTATATISPKTSALTQIITP